MKSKWTTLLATAVLPTLILLSLVWALTTPTLAGAATITVTTTTDENDGCGVGACSLREAIASAAVDDTISLAGGAYVLTLGEITLNKNLTLQGAGTAVTFIDGGDASRIFSLSGGSAITLTDMTLQHGRASNGGAVFVSFGSTLVISNTILNHNTATGNGGGVYLDTGSLTLRSGQILSNTANNGGGVFINASSAIFVETSGVISDNLANANGGGIYIGSGQFVMNGGLIQSNSANPTTGFPGGGLYVGLGKAILNNGEIRENSAYRGGGMALDQGKVTLSGASILSNTATYGGGIYLFQTTAAFTQTGGVIAYNRATTTGSFGGGAGYLFQGIFRSFEIHHNTSLVDGGGLHVTNATAVFDGANLHDNSASGNGGALHVRNSTGVLTVTNSTLSNNSPQAISMYAGSAHITGSQIDNSSSALWMTSGTMTAYANNILTYTTGFVGTGGTFNGRYNFWGSGATSTGVGSADAYNYRLGANVSSWGQGALGNASLTTAGGSGAGIIISHGRGLANTPFGSGVSPDADANNMCSDYYDFFVIGGGGNWVVTVPIDSGAACDPTFANAKLYGYTLSGTTIDETCTGVGCWTPYGGVSQAAGPSRALQVTLDAATQLQATPIVAGNHTTGTPSAVSLQALAGYGRSPSHPLLGLMSLFVTATWLIWRRHDRPKLE
ncbi:MAG: CSLREA domain-containing protein, partial [Anaerolineae bacterium]